MKSQLKIKTNQLVLVATLLSTAALNALAGGTSGGGSFKHPLSIANENIMAITNSALVNSKLIGGAWFIEKIEKIGSKPHQTYVYQLVATHFYAEGRCTLEVDVQNGNDATAAPAAVTDVRGQCVEPVIKKETPKVSIMSTASDYFKNMNLSLDGDRPYREYLDAARKVSASRRKEILNQMKDSAEAKFYVTYNTKKEQMVQFLKQKPNVTTAEFYQFLGAEIMHLETEGFIVPIIVGLDLVPLFVVDDL